MKRTPISLCATVALCTAACAENIFWDGAADLAKDPTIGATAANPVDLYTATFTNASGAAASPKSQSLCLVAASSPMYVTNTHYTAGSETTTYYDCLRFNSGDFVVLGPIAHMNDLHNNVAGETASITKRGDWWLKDFRLPAANDSNIAFTNETGALTIRGNAYLGGYSSTAGVNSNAKFVTLSSDEIGIFSSLTVCMSPNTEASFEANGTGGISVGTSLHVGYGAGSTGRFEANGSGYITVGTSINIGSGSDSTAQFVQSGSGKVSSKGFFVAGKSGASSTIVKNAGTLSNVGESFQLCKAANTATEFYHHGGSTYLSIAHLQLGATADGTTANMKSLFVIDGGAVTNASTGAYTTAIGNGGDAASSAQMFVTNNGSFYAANYFYVGNRAKGTLTIGDEGLVEVPNQPVVFCNNALCAAGRDCAINLDGGTLLAKQIAYGSGSAAATLTFNGGTLKAAAGAGSDFIQDNANLTVTVGAQGGVIDTSLASVTIPADISGTGGLTFKGGNSATVAGTLSYAGATTVELGTTLTVSGRADVFDTSAGLVCLVPAKIEDRETRTLLSTSGEDAFTAADLAKCSFSGFGNVKFTLSGDGKSICARVVKGLIISVR